MNRKEAPTILGDRLTPLLVAMLQRVVSRSWLRSLDARIRILSLRRAAAEQGLTDTVRQLVGIVPDVREQYTSFELDEQSLKGVNVRILHAFQMAMVEAGLSLGCNRAST